MKHFLILFDDLPIDKDSVKSGNNSPEIITAARCVNVGLFISGGMRRDVVVSFAKGAPDELNIVLFPGATLKRVSPDERSISFFLMKAFSIAEELMMGSFKIMDNGIEVRKSSLADFIKSVDPSRIYISSPEISSNIMSDVEYDGSLLLYFVGKQFGSIQIDTRWTQVRLPYFPHPERFILDVNMLVDNKLN